MVVPQNDPLGAQLTADVAISRYMDACAGRHRWPIDNDGFMYTWPGRDQSYVSDIWAGNSSAVGVGRSDADWRYWGGGFWWWNQRVIVRVMLFFDLHGCSL